jgi:3-oxoacyl-[acyl-carrier protein] reductase
MSHAASSNAPPVCVVTGGSAGIGLAVGLRFGRGGYRVVICGRDPGRLEAARAAAAAVAPDCLAMPLDVGQPGEAARLIDDTVKRFGRVDVLVNNAGHAPMAPLEALSAADFELALAVNVGAVFHATRAVWPAMRGQGRGVVVNISSLASVDPFPGFSVYGACKAWVNLFTKAIADEGRPLGIRAYAVAPGAVETPLLRRLFANFPAEQTLSPDAVADVVAAVCEDPLRHASGSTLFVRK